MLPGTPKKLVQGGFVQRMAKGPDGGKGFAKSAGRGGAGAVSPPMDFMVVPSQGVKLKALPVKGKAPSPAQVSPQISFAQAAMGKKSPASTNSSPQINSTAPPPIALTPQQEVDPKVLARARAAEEAARKQRQLEQAAEQHQRAVAVQQRAEQKAAAEQDKKMTARAMAAEEAARKQRQLEAAARVQEGSKALSSPKQQQQQQYFDQPGPEQPQKSAWGAPPKSPTTKQPQSPTKQPTVPPHQPLQPRKPAWGAPDGPFKPNLNKSLSMPEPRDLEQFDDAEVPKLAPSIPQPPRQHQHQQSQSQHQNQGRHNQGRQSKRDDLWDVGEMGTFGEEAPGVFSSGIPQASEEERERARLQVEEFLRSRPHHPEPKASEAPQHHLPPLDQDNNDDTDEVFCFGGAGVNAMRPVEEEREQGSGWGGAEEWEVKATGQSAWSMVPPSDSTGRRGFELVDEEVPQGRVEQSAWKQHQAPPQQEMGFSMVDDARFGGGFEKSMMPSHDFDLADEEDAEGNSEEEAAAEEEAKGPVSASDALKNMLGIGMFGGGGAPSIPAPALVQPQVAPKRVWGKPDGALDISVDPAIAQITKAPPPENKAGAPQQQNGMMQQQQRQQQQQPDQQREQQQQQMYKQMLQHQEKNNMQQQQAQQKGQLYNPLQLQHDHNNMQQQQQQQQKSQHGILGMPPGAPNAQGSGQQGGDMAGLHNRFPDMGGQTPPGLMFLQQQQTSGGMGMGAPGAMGIGGPGGGQDRGPMGMNARGGGRAPGEEEAMLRAFAGLGFPQGGGPSQQMMEGMQRGAQNAFGMGMWGMPQQGMGAQGGNKDGSMPNNFGMPHGGMSPADMQGMLSAIMSGGVGGGGGERGGLPPWLQQQQQQQGPGYGFPDQMMRGNGQQHMGGGFGGSSGGGGMPGWMQGLGGGNGPPPGMNMGGGHGGQHPGDGQGGAQQGPEGGGGGLGGFDFGKVFGGMSCGASGPAPQMPMAGKVLSLAEIEGRQFTG